MNEGSSDECLHHVVSTQMVIFRAIMDRTFSSPNGESALCDHLVFLKRLALLNEAVGKHLAKESLPPELIKIAGETVLSEWHLSGLMSS